MGVIRHSPTSRWSQSTGKGAHLWLTQVLSEKMKRVFYLTFGFLAVLIGFGIAVWLFYNLLIERQAEFTGIWSLGQFFMPFVMIGWGIYWLRKGLKSSNLN